MKEVTYLFFDSTQSADFGKYFSYFEYFASVVPETGREQGTFFYYLHSLHLYSYSEYFTDNNFFYFLNKSVQLVNFYFYCFGLIGFYFLLKELKINKSAIFWTFVCINFFPMLIAMRITFKPEILIFSLLPWGLFFIEKYKVQNKILYLLMAIPFLALLLSTKGSAFGMVGLYLLITYYKILFTINLKKLVLILLLSTTVLGSLIIQDSTINGSSILEVVHEEKYNNIASRDIIYNFDFVKTIKSPIKNNHADSFISLTLLDTFGDYFDIYWNNDSSLMFKDRNELISLNISNQLQPPKINVSDLNISITAQKNTDLYTRASLGLVYSVIFYFMLARSVFSKNKFSKFLFAPAVGMMLLLVQSVIGFPVKNWDPLVGDSVKPFYYGFFLSLSFIFLVIHYINKNRYLVFLIPIFILSTLFIIGFPKNISQSVETQIYEVNTYSSQCSINKYLFDSLKYFNTDFCENNLNIGLRQKYLDYEEFKIAPNYLIINNIFFLYIIICSLYMIYRESEFASSFFEKSLSRAFKI
jgi:hypothetical protein